MTNRELVLNHVTRGMIAAFRVGNILDAQNMQAMLVHLEGITDEEYAALQDETNTGVIS